MSALRNAPTSEQGSPSQYGPALPGLMSWSQLAGDEQEPVPALQWPQSVSTFREMRNDSQIDGLFLGAFAPILQQKFAIRPNGAEDRYVQALAEDLGLPIEGAEDEPRGRTKRRFKFKEHMRQALLAGVYGHEVFEQVGEIKGGMWRLRKLAERPPFTISEWALDQDGGLRGIRQAIGAESPLLDVNRLLVYVWDKEGANWYGRSMIRSCYRPWLIKDRVIRVGAINIERNGAGVPVGKAPQDATSAEMASLNRAGAQLRAGEESSITIPYGADLRLLGVDGSQPDAAGYIRLMNEEMARSFVMMFMQLGQTETGSRALGKTFVDYAKLSQDMIRDWFLDNFNEHMVEDWMDWNVGEDAPAPLVVAVEDKEDPAPMGPLDGLANALETAPGAGDGVQADPELAAAIRNAANMTPARGHRRASGARKRAGADLSSGADASPALPLPARPLRRQPYDHEVRAAADFAQIDSDLESNRMLLAAEYRTLQQQTINELHDAIVEANGDLTKLAGLTATPPGQGVLAARFAAMAEQGVTQHVNEVQRQGRTVERPDLKKVVKSLEARAEATDELLTRALVQSASANALRLTGGSLAPAEVAAQVTAHLRNLSGSYVEDQLGGALTASMNAGRKAVMGRANPDRIYSSELLDFNTCTNCTTIDGTEYGDLSAAERDYPTGGYSDCLGGTRCRGTLVAVYGEDG